METRNRPVENGTAKSNTANNPAAQGNGQRTSRASGQTGRAPLRRPSDAQRGRGTSDAQTRTTTARGEGNVRSVTQRQPIRPKADEEGNGFTLGSVPRASAEDKKHRKNNDYVPTKKSNIKEPMPLATIVFSILCTVLVMFMMINFVKINEYTHDIADMQDQLAKLEREEQELSVELEKKNDLTGVNLEELGLVKEDDLKKVEITTDNEETTEHYEVEEEDVGMVATVMNALSKNFKEYRNIFFGSE